MCDVLEVLLGDQCGSNMGGTKRVFYYTGFNDILTHATKAVSITNPEDEYKMSVAPVFKSGKSWKKVEITQDSGVNNITPGGANSGAKQNNFVFRTPSNSMAGTVLFNAIANGIYPIHALVEDANMPDGTYDQIGTSKLPANITAQKINGTNTGDGSMYEFTIANTQPARLFFTAAVVTTPAA